MLFEIHFIPNYKLILPFSHSHPFYLSFHNRSLGSYDETVSVLLYILRYIYNDYNR